MLSFEFGWQLFKPLIKDDLIDSPDFIFSRKEKKEQSRLENLHFVSWNRKLSESVFTEFEHFQNSVLFLILKILL